MQLSIRADNRLIQTVNGSPKPLADFRFQATLTQVATAIATAFNAIPHERPSFRRQLPPLIINVARCRFSQPNQTPPPPDARRSIRSGGTVAAVWR